MKLGDAISSVAIYERLRKLEELHDNFRMIGGANVTVQGSLKDGFAVCATCPPEQTGPIPIGVPPPSETGACCVDGECSILTSAACTEAGGTYQGDDTACDPNPCAEEPTGACCITGICSILSPEDCADASGYYFGDGSDCDSDPCSTIGCCVYFDGDSDVCANITHTECDELDGLFSDNGFCAYLEDTVGGIGPQGWGCCESGRDTVCSFSVDDAVHTYCCGTFIGETCCNILGCCAVDEFCCEFHFPGFPENYVCCPEGSTCDPIEGCV